MIKHLNIKIFGQVQGVLFRSSTQKIADQLNISGFIKNESNGTVYIEAEGEEKDLERFVSWCKKGPKFAQVAKVEVNPEDLKNFNQFQVN